MMIASSISIIGGADGPTSVFLASRLGMNWINIFGIIVVVLMLIPNIIYAIVVKDQKNKCTNRVMNILEQIGRYGCMILMILNIGIPEFGYYAVGAFLVYLFGNVILILAYWIVWMFYFKKQTYGKQMALAVIPTCIFLLSGVMLLHWLLIIFGIIFGIAHIYVTSQNRVE